MLVGLVVPFLVCLALRPFRDDLANTNAALVLVLVVVGVAASGNRVAGALTALSAAASFDFFLTRPFETLAITDRADVETTVLLLAVGVGVTELAAWGYRQQSLAVREASYLAGIREAAAVVSTGSSSGSLVDAVARQLVTVLDLSGVRFEYGVAGLGRPPRLQPDGSVVCRSSSPPSTWDVERQGLPTGQDIELLVESKGRLQGRFLLRAAPGARPTLSQRLVAVTLAGQVGASMR
jgi:hypothetical protein